MSVTSAGHVTGTPHPRVHCEHVERGHVTLPRSDDGCGGNTWRQAFRFIVLYISIDIERTLYSREYSQSSPESPFGSEKKIETRVSHHLHPPHSRLVRNIRDVMAALASLAPLTRALPASARMTPGRPMDRPQRIRSASGLASRPAVPSDAPTRRGETIVMMTYPEPEV